jgi:hypothetical protein
MFYIVPLTGRHEQQIGTGGDIENAINHRSYPATPSRGFDISTFRLVEVCILTCVVSRRRAV